MDNATNMALIVHGGAGNIPRSSWDEHRRGCERAAECGWRILIEGGTALQAVEAAIVIMEDDPVFDAGIGSVLNRDGLVEMDAGIMDGATLESGACAAVTRVKNVIRLARAILDSENIMLVALGAERAAMESDMELLPPASFITEREWRRWHEFLANPPPAAEFYNGGTVGCVAVDRQGNVAAGTSTGGRDFKMPGRVGDSPLIGSGFYADNRGGGASTTGWGEGIARLALSKWAVDEMARGTSPFETAHKAVELLQTRVNGQGGIILADPSGRIGCWHNAEAMARAWIVDGAEQVRSEIHGTGRRS